MTERSSSRPKEIDIEALAFAPPTTDDDDVADEDHDGHVPTFRPDLIVNGLAALLVGIVVSVVLFQNLQPGYYLYGFVGWVVIGTPCCLISGTSSLLAILNLDIGFGRGLRCDVKK